MTVSTSVSREQSDAPRKAPFKYPWLVGFLIGAAVLTVLPMIATKTLRAPPPLGPLGAWSLVDQWGKPISNDTLKGQVWIASFFFSRCPSVCPQQQKDMASLWPHLEDLKDRVHLVSFSVDPDFDHPEVLNAYARKLDADQTHWSFVTGPKDALKTLLIDKMRVDMGDRRELAGSPELFDISHANRFALIDQNGDLRGFWETHAEGRGNLINAARLLVKRGPKV